MKKKDLIYRPPVAQLIIIVVGMVLLAGCGRRQHRYDGNTGVDWPAYGGNKAGNRYSPLDQINADNVGRLAVAWTFNTGENTDSTGNGHEIQCQPIVVNGVLYGTTPELHVFAVNAADGRLLWKFETPYVRQRFNTNRGVLYWEKDSDRRILYSSGSGLYAIDAATGKLVSTFGQNGVVDLHEGLEAGLGHPVDQLMVTATTPGEHSGTVRAVADVGKAGQDSGVEFPYEPAYTIKVWRQFTDQQGYPAVKPPWGTLNAIDLNTGEYVWRVPLGEYPELVAKGIRATGTESYGGPLVTAGGLLFIAGTRDRKLRAFDKLTGKVVWEYQLPASAYATPISYSVDGKQYIAIADGGGRGGNWGSDYIAFSLQ